MCKHDLLNHQAITRKFAQISSTNIYLRARKNKNMGRKLDKLSAMRKLNSDNIIKQQNLVHKNQKETPKFQIIAICWNPQGQQFYTDILQHLSITYSYRVKYKDFQTLP